MSHLAKGGVKIALSVKYGYRGKMKQLAAPAVHTLIVMDLCRYMRLLSQLIVWRLLLGCALLPLWCE